VKELSLTSVKNITPELILDWKLDTTLGLAILLCPTLWHILQAAAQMEKAKSKNKIKDPDTVSLN